MPDLNRKLADQLKELSAKFDEAQQRYQIPDIQMNVKKIHHDLQKQIDFLRTLKVQIMSAEYDRIQANGVALVTDIQLAMENSPSEESVMSVVGRSVSLIGGGGFVRKYTCPGPVEHVIASPKCPKHEDARPYPKW